MKTQGGNMKKLLLVFFSFSMFLIFPISGQTKEAKYKGLFNLATDSKYYKYVNYKANNQSDKSLLLKIIDKRPEQEKVFDENVQYFYDDIWADPPIKMLGKIFLKELRASNIFKSVDFDENTPSLVLEIELTSLIGHYDDEGRVARGVVKIHHILRSTLDKRVIKEKIYEETKSCLVGRFQNAYRYIYRNIGDALNAVVKEMMGDLENTLAKEFGK
jgi:ABC-type uncharacterized transport system auxiliary subunit